MAFPPSIDFVAIYVVMQDEPRAPRARALRSFVTLALLTTVLTAALAQDDPAGGGIQVGIDDSGEQVLIVPFRGTFDGGVVAKRLSLIETQIEKHPRIQWVIFEIDADSDDYEAGKRLAEYILEGESLRGKTTVAYIPPPGSTTRDSAGRLLTSRGQAFGAAALPVIACREIALGANTRLGAGDTVNPMIDDETRVTIARAAEKYAAQRNRHVLLARLMVAKSRQRIYKLERKGDRLAAWERYAFWTQDELNRDTSDRRLKYRPETLFLEQDRHLTLDAKSAYDFGWARHRGVEHDTTEYADLRDKLGLHGPSTDVIHVDRGALERGSVSWQALVDVINHPATRFFLILIGFLGVFLEIKMFGTMVPGMIGLLCFGIFFAGGMFAATGAAEPTATWFEAVLFTIGLLLVACEFLLLPGVGVFGLGGCVVCLVSLVLAMVPGAGDGATSVKEAIATLAAGFGGSGVCFLLLLRFLPKSRWLSRGIVTRATIEGVPSADSAGGSALELDWMVGKTGTARTPLRPAGKVLLKEGKLLDVVADGEFIEMGAAVVVRSCSSTRILVTRPTEPA